MTLELTAAETAPARQISIDELADLVHPYAAVAWDRDGCSEALSACSPWDHPRIDTWAPRGRLEGGIAALIVSPRGANWAAVMVFVCDPVPHWRPSRYR